MIVVVAAFLTLHGPDNQVIFVNPDEIVSFRAPRGPHFAPQIECSIQTVDGRLINVVESCDVVRDLFLRGGP